MLKLLVTADLDCLCTGEIGLRLLVIGTGRIGLRLLVIAGLACLFTGGIGLRLLVIVSLDSFVKGVLVPDYWLLHH